MAQSRNHRSVPSESNFRRGKVDGKLIRNGVALFVYPACRSLALMESKRQLARSALLVV
jgi:hypothetical protein